MPELITRTSGMTTLPREKHDMTGVLFSMGYTRLRFPFYMTKEIPLASGAVRLREILNLHISFCFV